MFLLKAGSTNRETYFLESRKNGGGNNRGNRSSTRFTFPGFNHRIQPGGEKRSARIKITAPCARRYRAEIKMGIAVWFPLRPNLPRPPRPRFSRIRREDRSFECITNLKPGVSIKQRLDPPPPPLRPLGWFPGMCSRFGDGSFAWFPDAVYKLIRQTRGWDRKTAFPFLNGVPRYSAGDAAQRRVPGGCRVISSH